LNPCRVKIGLATACPMLTAALALARAVHGRLITAAMRLHIIADKVDRIVVRKRFSVRLAHEQLDDRIP